MVVMRINSRADRATEMDENRGCSEHWSSVLGVLRDLSTKPMAPRPDRQAGDDGIVRVITVRIFTSVLVQPLVLFSGIVAV